jgi:MoxR-like ATPase
MTVQEEMQGVAPATEIVARLGANLASVIRGKPEAIRLLLIALLAGGHALLEDVPGTGKTTLAKSLARSMDGAFRRIQFTPDLLPADITGSAVYNPADGSFTFREGPVFANVVLADEINRTSPRTQSALLEVMSEGQVTADGRRRDLPRPFFVVATQNPTDFGGTYPLPEAQLDRFALRITLGYPELGDELDILYGQRERDPFDDLRPVVSGADVLRLQAQVRAVRVDRAVAEYLLRLVAATRADPRVRLAVSPRGSLTLFRAAQARALTEGRPYALPDDVRALALPALAHRLLLDARAGHGGLSGAQVLAEALETVPVPR